MTIFYPPEIAHLCQLRDKMLANGDTNPHHWRELAKRFLYAGAISNAQKCLERAEYFFYFFAREQEQIEESIN
jgi:hypothetical protein